jgi:hypothetical protein
MCYMGREIFPGFDSPHGIVMNLEKYGNIFAMNVKGLENVKELNTYVSIR